ncbi:FCS-Like Zinc finger 10-like [Amaranthus tricolor]|uniref:FCS-Like Zinc finger 10-like n=1 Tax=Amaranthus tricolor TaxID=29722 RepID=UPI0025842676|nr:FCS-Like Zinc finger 10-like [Amaranthus tricolor]
MAGKRSAILRSSTSGDTSILSGGSIFESEIRWSVLDSSRKNSQLNQSIQIMDPEMNQPQIVRKRSSVDHRPSIFSIGNSDHVFVDRKWDELAQFGCFLEKCFLCKKKISEDDEVFMYSNLRAFCSYECRKKQINMDDDLKKLAAKRKLKYGKRRF